MSKITITFIDWKLEIGFELEDSRVVMGNKYGIHQKGGENMIIIISIILTALFGYLFTTNLIDAIKSTDEESFKSNKEHTGIFFVLWSLSFGFTLVLFFG